MEQAKGNDMNEAEAFELYYRTKTGSVRYCEAERRGWQAACEWMRGQGEPVAYLFQHEDTGLTDFIDLQQIEWGFEKNNPRWHKIGPVFTIPPTAQINEQMREALQFVIDCHESTNGSDYQSGSALREAASMAKAVLAATPK